jgi:hypothetical protein
MYTDTCILCDPSGTNARAPLATRTTAQGEPVCARHWREAGMYDPGQGYEPTERDYEAFGSATGEVA